MQSKEMQIYKRIVGTRYPMTKQKSELRIINELLPKYGLFPGDKITVLYEKGKITITKKED